MSSWFTRGFGMAIADIRQRAVEEPWFGRAVTPRAQTITLGSQGEKSPGDGLDHEQSAELERDIDR